MSARRPIKSVTICKPHGAALLIAAHGCGCRTDDELMQFIADMLESTLYFPVRLLVGDAVDQCCVCCSYLYPGDAINDAVVGALALRAKHGVAKRLN
jgi:hypothetical protein